MIRVKLYFHFYFVFLKGHFIAKGQLVSWLHNEGVLSWVLHLEIFIENANLIESQRGPFEVVTKHNVISVFGMAVNNVQKVDCVRVLHLKTQYTIVRNIGAIPHHKGVGVVVDGKRPWIAPHAAGLQSRNFYLLRFGLVLPKERHSLARLEHKRLLGLNLAYLQLIRSCIG